MLKDEIQLLYGSRKITLPFSENELEWYAYPRKKTPLPDIEAAVVEALRNPTAGPSLKKLVEDNGKNVVLLVDDITRMTPQDKILPVLLDELNRNAVPDSCIKAIIGLGTHRPMSQEEKEAVYGLEVTERIPVINHDSKDRKQLVEVPNSDSRIPVMVNRYYYESDISIAVGNIIPHMYAGWAGGAKMVQPGVCGDETTAETHFIAAGKVHEIVGRLDNPVREEIENIAEITGLTMILNTVLNADNQVVSIVSGEPRNAFCVGVEKAREIYEIELKNQCDLVIASAYPAELDFWQSIKALNNCSMAVRRGGIIILLAADPDGVAPDHPDFLRLGTVSTCRARKLYTRGEVKDKVALSTYHALEVNRSRVEVVLLSEGITADDAEQIGFKKMGNIEKALDYAFSKLGHDIQIGAVNQGANLYFRVGNDKKRD